MENKRSVWALVAATVAILTAGILPWAFGSRTTLPQACALAAGVGSAFMLYLILIASKREPRE